MNKTGQRKESMY